MRQNVTYYQNSPTLGAEELSISGVEEKLARINKHPPIGTARENPT